MAACLGFGQSIDLGLFPAPMRKGEGNTARHGGRVISCFRPRVIDGDTFTCDGTRIRLANIDAPELPGHCRPGRHCVQGDAFAARDHLGSLASGYVTCRAAELDHYGRTVAFCEAEGADLSCAMVKSGHAARRYGGLACQD
jgi:endonuclease YncB( thermonuclease family)